MPRLNTTLALPTLLALLATGTPVTGGEGHKEKKPEEKLIIGATADFLEEASGLRLTARVDTGATTCSIHAEDVQVEDAAKKMTKNIGKKVTFVLLGPDGKRESVESTIADTVRVKTSDKDRWERRYKVWLTLRHNGVSRRVHVTLNNRKHMEYRLLIGRNYLCGHFLVDVATKHSPLPEPDKESQAADASGEAVQASKAAG